MLPNAADLVPARGPLLIGLDRDGTLVPYAKHPKEALTPKAVNEVIHSLLQLPDVVVAVISARCCKQLVADFSDASKLILAGNYGLEIFYPGGAKFLHDSAQRAESEVEKLQERLEILTKEPIGAVIDNHVYSLCLHWKLVPLDHLDVVHDAVDQWRRRLINLKCRKMPTSYEFLPLVPWSKANALDLIARQSFSAGVKPFALFAGDSAADEPAFRWANERKGVSVRVGEVPVETSAQFQMRTSEDLLELLQAIVQKRRGKRS